MKLGKGSNEYRLNTDTMVAILNKHLEYHSDQVVTGVVCVNNGGRQTFVVSLEDKKQEAGNDNN